MNERRSSGNRFNRGKRVGTRDDTGNRIDAVAIADSRVRTVRGDFDAWQRLLIELQDSTTDPEACGCADTNNN